MPNSRFFFFNLLKSYFVIQKVPLVRAVLYIISQSVGAIAGSALVRALSPDTMQGYLGIVGLQAGVSPVQGLGVEFFLGLVLVLVVCGATDGAKPESRGVAPVIIGLAITVGHFVGVRN